MKKYLDKLFILLLAFTLVIPTFVFAEGEEENDSEETETTKSPVRVYEFYGSTCGYCAALNEWFDSIEEEYGDYFDVIKLEVWENAGNAALMESTADELEISVTGVPFVVIGENYTTGFDEATSPNTILGYIMAEYEKDEADRIDIVNVDGDYVAPEEDTTATDIMIGVGAVILVVGIVVVIIKARKED